ncbi:hypothetical protein [Vibrio gallaecicus]|nr:hypothetical protein [Vibrio gallaecicus]MDN3613417.1 hypothetical protein [Vibrio gallaecicus]
MNLNYSFFLGILAGTLAALGAFISFMMLSWLAIDFLISVNNVA